MPTSITGNVKDILGVANVGGVKVRLSLKWSGGGTPRVNGTALVLSSGASWNDRVISDMAIDANGAITGSVYSTRDAAGTGNGEIEVNGSLTACYYEVQVSKIGGQTFKFPVHAKNGATLDLTNATPISTSPVVAAPTGDTTYARLDGGNTPFTGLVQFLQGILLALGKSVAWSTDLFLGRGAAGKLTVGTTAGATDGTVSAALYQVGGVSQVGTGPLVGQTNTTLVTPTIGIATATSVNKVAITPPSGSATLTIANGKTLTANNSLTLAAGADGTTQTFQASDTIVGQSTTDTLKNKALQGASSGNSVTLIDIQDPGGAVTNNGSDQTIYTKTLSAGQIGAGKSINVRWGVLSSNAVAVTYKLILGTTTIQTFTSGASIENVQTDIDISNNVGVQNIQHVRYILYEANTIPQNGLTASAATENTANSLVLKLVTNAASGTVTGKFWKVVLDQ